MVRTKKAVQLGDPKLGEFEILSKELREGSEVALVGDIGAILSGWFLVFSGVGLTLNILASDAGKCFSTVDRLLSGETRFPRFSTVVSIALALQGYTEQVGVEHFSSTPLEDLCKAQGAYYKGLLKEVKKAWRAAKKQ